ncbi:MAG: outer membrane protein assembly factor BamD [Pedobacter agri]|uniref:Outer membrane protein assembly factor BamD n=1 Tax=Pedobacter agri TaxID=454586 RepID=A0A9X3DEG5_9SPHI|nr:MULTISPECIES: outer membrane protein assembly factor BamD [Pedobacter]AZI23806.1 outer membrane protein assembly factor BamD [Pedobacter sp. G11]MCX3266258.1 outer membrane protein assembly factor BamD [Pedobacter agri]MDQ1139793.1 outer membrane protein assembly factor BamD [Pedobacter agri]RZJ82242.1 MAG: outer membrane protein assembly factor BamD [Flavobacterium sp.]
MFKVKHLIILVFVAALGIAGCKSRFEKLRASNDVAKKYQEALRLYNKRDYSKALVLFEDLSQKYRGRAEAEDLNYYYAYTLYRLSDYTTARYQFKSFADTYPASKNAEEARYMGAYCYYLESPSFSLDQENTYKAIDALQLFINLYPNSDRAAAAGKYIADLRGKLEDKAFENAKMYLTTGPSNVDNYRAAVIALKNAQRDYPDIKYAEEMDFLMIKAQYLYAKNSYIIRQEDRYNEAIELYTEFTENHPDSKFTREAKQLKKDVEDGIVASKQELALYAADQEKYKQMLIRTGKLKDTVSTKPTTADNTNIKN